MDEIQKVLIKVGRKDLAQKYYEKLSQNVSDQDVKTFISKQLKKNMREKGLEKVIRDALFTFGKVDWQRLKDSIKANMPEIKEIA